MVHERNLFYQKIKNVFCNQYPNFYYDLIDKLFVLIFLVEIGVETVDI